MTFTWQAPSTGGVPASYVVEAALSPGGVVIASLPVASGPLVVPGVPNGVYYVTYYIRVLAVNAFGGSAATSDVVLTVGATPTPTPTPVNADRKSDSSAD